MSSTVSRSRRSQIFGFDHVETLTFPERIAVLVFVIGSVTLDVVGLIADGGTDEPLQSIVGIGLSLTLLLFIWWPSWAIISLGVMMAFAFMVGNATQLMLGGSLAALLVLRVATAQLIVAYGGGLLISSALLLYGYGSPDGERANIAVYLIIAAVAGAVGVALRTAYARGRILENELEEQAEKERQAIIAERRWIAGELHDSIAHHLTIIALHVQMLDDERVRPTSQDAISMAARKALTDLRFVIKIAEDEPQGTEVLTGDFAAAIKEARGEFEAAGHPTVIEGDPEDEGIPRGAEIILARVVRESATNVIKYAGPGNVHFVIDVAPTAVTMTIRSPLPTGAPRVNSSTGTGLNRMAERVLGLSGEFSAGPVEDEWHVVARLPFAPSASAIKATSE